MFVAGNGSNSISCVCCGAQGRLTVQTDGIIVPEWDLDCSISSITMKGKLHHLDYLSSVNAKLKPVMGSTELAAARQKWASVGIPQVLLPSRQAL